MKAFILDPLAYLGLREGYRRPLDRHDFPHGHIPDAVGRFIPGMGELHRHANLTINQGDSASGVDMYGSGLSQIHPLGTIALTRDGRVFRYGQAGAVALVAGTLNQSAIPIANHLALTSAAQAIGDGIAPNPIVVTPAATAGAANLYAEGYLNVSLTPGNGQVFRVSGHAAITASTAFNLFLDPDDRLQIAFTTATRYGLHHNPWKNTIILPTTQTASPAGWPLVALAIAAFGWFQTRGPVSALIDGTPAITTPVVNSGSVAGAVAKWTTAAADVAVIPVGRMMQTGVDTKNNLVFAQID